MTTERTAGLRAPATEAVTPDPPWRTAAAEGRNEVTVIRQDAGEVTGGVSTSLPSGQVCRDEPANTDT